MAAPGWHAREALATRLKELRDATGLNQAEFAQRLGAGWDQPKVSRIEVLAKREERKGRVPSRADLEAWAAATGAGLEELAGLRRRAEIERDLIASFKDRFAKEGGAEQHQRAIAAAEAASGRLAFCYPLIVPGIVQTADYAREMLHLDGGPATYGSSEDDISRMIAARLRRQPVLHEPGRQITVLIGEAALRSRVASPETMRMQCEHVASLATSLRTATIGIIPFSAQLPFASISAWSILDDIVLIEAQDEDSPIADPAEVERYWRYTRTLLSVAVTGAEAAALCLQVAAEMTA